MSSWKCLDGEVMTSSWVLCFLEAHRPFPVLFSLIKYLLKIHDWNQTFHICKYFHLNSEGMAFRENSFPDPITGFKQWRGMLGYPCQRRGRLLISPLSALLLSDEDTNDDGSGRNPDTRVTQAKAPWMTITKAERRECVIYDPGDRNGGNWAVCGYSQEKGISDHVEERERVPKGLGPKSPPKSSVAGGQVNGQF